MSRIEPYVSSLVTNTPLLIHTTDLQTNPLGASWEIVREEYETASSSEARILTSVLNAIVTQKRVFYCITRDKTRDLVSNDPNWKESAPGFRQDRWKIILKLLIASGLGQPVHPGKGRRPSIYRLSTSWYDLLGVDDTWAGKEDDVLAFVKNVEGGDGSGD